MTDAEIAVVVAEECARHGIKQSCMYRRNHMRDAMHLDENGVSMTAVRCAIAVRLRDAGVIGRRIGDAVGLSRPGVRLILRKHDELHSPQSVAVVKPLPAKEPIQEIILRVCAEHGVNPVALRTTSRIVIDWDGREVEIIFVRGRVADELRKQHRVSWDECARIIGISPQAARRAQRRYLSTLEPA